MNTTRNTVAPMFRVVLLLVIACSLSSARASTELTCTISGASEVSAIGALEPLAGGKNYYETVAGAEFIVQRDTGQMMGRFVNNAGWKITVIDPGSSQTSFKAVSVRKGGRVQSQFFEVRLQDKGDRKPFVLVAAEILHGTCAL
ncbi:MAG: hypothetical protein ACKOAO_03945 [Oxalobacteraceae bacterium]